MNSIQLYASTMAVLCLSLAIDVCSRFISSIAWLHHLTNKLVSCTFLTGPFKDHQCVQTNVKNAQSMISVMQLSTYVAWWTADIFGRKTLFVQAGFQMAAALIVVAVSLKELGQQGVWMAWYILAVICVYDM